MLLTFWVQRAKKKLRKLSFSGFSFPYKISISELLAFWKLCENHAAG